MKFLSNAHTHTNWCDGLSTAEEQLASARRLGFVSLGFSGHAMQGFDWKYCMSAENQRAYLAELRGMQERLAGRGPKIYAGLEQDEQAPEAEKAKNRVDFDYLIGSVHYLPGEPGGERVAVDGNLAMLRNWIDQRCGGDARIMARGYYEQYGVGMEKDRPDILGHFDLVRKYAVQIGLNTGLNDYRRYALDALARARRGCAVLEVNTGNIARGYDTRPYPEEFLLDAWKELGGELTLTSDCHDARLLDCAFEPTVVWLRSRGWKRLLRLGTGNALWDEVEI